METWSRGTNSRLPFEVNVMLILSDSCHLNAHKMRFLSQI